MGSNRAQRRAAYKKGKRQGETYADVLAKQKMIKEAVDRSVHDESVALESDIKTQRFLWMSIAALNVAFGFAGVRAQRYMSALDEVREDMEKMAKKNGWEYAIEKLREQCQKITGIEVKQVHEEAMLQARKENEAKGIFFTAEDPEDLAAIGFTCAISNKEDAVEVVRCESCKYWVEGRHHTGRCNALVQFHDAERYMTDAGHFCSYGERKAGNHAE